MSISRYECLNRKTIVVHDEQRCELSEAALTELEQFQVFEFYSQEKMLRISQAKGVQEEIDNLVSSVLAERKKSPEGSNQECMAMDMLTEFISKLDLDDFRKLKIERLIDDEDHKRSL